jgi:hypothetical protein
MMKQSKKSFRSPASAVAPQATTILSRLPTLSVMRCNHLDAAAVGQSPIQAVTVVGFGPINRAGTALSRISRGKTSRGRPLRTSWPGSSHRTDENEPGIN